MQRLPNLQGTNIDSSTTSLYVSNTSPFCLKLNFFFFLNHYLSEQPVPQIHQNGLGFKYMLEIIQVGSQAESAVPIAITEWRTDHYEMSAQNVYEAYKITISAANNDGPAEGDPTSITGYSYEQSKFNTP